MEKNDPPVTVTTADADPRVWDLFHRYFDYFHKHHFLPHEWTLHFIQHIAAVFEAQDAADEAKAAKDAALDALDISPLISEMDLSANAWEDAASGLKVTLSQSASQRAAMESAAETLTNYIKGITFTVS